MGLSYGTCHCAAPPRVQSEDMKIKGGIQYQMGEKRKKICGKDCVIAFQPVSTNRVKLNCRVFSEQRNSEKSGDRHSELGIRNEK